MKRDRTDGIFSAHGKVGREKGKQPAGVFLALVGATRLNIPEDTILYSHRRENLKSYIGKESARGYVQSLSEVSLKVRTFLHPRVSKIGMFQTPENVFNRSKQS
jgi:hypothetical protein